MLDSSKHRMSTGFLHLALLILLASGTRGIARADTGFRTPSPELVAIADMPRSSQVRISPDGTRFLLLERSTADAQAAVDALVARGVCDPARVAVGGYSYGA